MTSTDWMKFNDKKWHQVVIVTDEKGQKKLYIDGIGQ